MKFNRKKTPFEKTGDIMKNLYAQERADDAVAKTTHDVYNRMHLRRHLRPVLKVSKAEKRRLKMIFKK